MICFSASPRPGCSNRSRQRSGWRLALIQWGTEREKRRRRLRRKTKSRAAPKRQKNFFGVSFSLSTASRRKNCFGGAGSAALDFVLAARAVFPRRAGARLRAQRLTPRHGERLGAHAPRSERMGWRRRAAVPHQVALVPVKLRPDGARGGARDATGAGSLRPSGGAEPRRRQLPIKLMRTKNKKPRTRSTRHASFRLYWMASGGGGIGRGGGRARATPRRAAQFGASRQPAPSRRHPMPSKTRETKRGGNERLHNAPVNPKQSSCLSSR